MKNTKEINKKSNTVNLFNTKNKNNTKKKITNKSSEKVERKILHMNHTLYLILQGAAFILTIASFLYFLSLTIYTGIHEFNFCFLLMSAGLLFCMIIASKSHNGKIRLPGFIPIGFWSLIIIGVICLSILLGMVLSGQSGVPKKNADYMVVLGAGVRGERPSIILQNRINAAAKYLQDNKNTVVVVSGGQGSAEDISEAEAMKRGLLKLGISENRIIKEDQSTSTTENMKFSLKKIPDGASTVLVTNKFHVYRAVYLAKKYGYKDITGIGADNVSWLNPANYLRECLAVVKDVIL